MKRSDMLKGIALNIAKQAISSGNQNVDLSWLDIEELLNSIENKGMLPPTTISPSKFQFLPVNKWEPEDEI